MKTLKISLISFTFMFAAITVASARQNALDKLKKAKENKNTAISKPKSNNAGGKNSGMAVKGQGASNNQSTKTNPQSGTNEPAKLSK